MSNLNFALRGRISQKARLLGGVFFFQNISEKSNFLGNSTTKWEIWISHFVVEFPKKLDFWGDVFLLNTPLKSLTFWEIRPRSGNLKFPLRGRISQKIRLLGGVLFLETPLKSLIVWEIRPRSVKFKIRSSWSNSPESCFFFFDRAF